jgi:hypothetical protein
MSRDSRWIEDQISEVMGYVRGAKSDPSIVGRAEDALEKLRDVAAGQEFPEKAAVVTSIEAAMAEVQANHATAAVQHLSRALMLVSRSRI